MTEYFTTAELATLFKIKKNTIERWRSSRTCPFQWIKVGNRVLYDKTDVLAYIEGQKRDKVGA